MVKNSVCATNLLELHIFFLLAIFYGFTLDKLEYH